MHIIEKRVGLASVDKEHLTDVYIDPTQDEWNRILFKQLPPEQIPASLKKNTSYRAMFGDTFYTVGGLLWNDHVFIWNRNGAPHETVARVVREKLPEFSSSFTYTPLMFFYNPHKLVVMVAYARNSVNPVDLKKYKRNVPPDFNDRLRRMSELPMFKEFAIVSNEGDVIIKDVPPQKPTPKKKRSMAESIMDELCERIVKVGSKYRLVSKKTGKNLGTYPTKAGAMRRERQVQYFKHRA